MLTRCSIEEQSPKWHTWPNFESLSNGLSMLTSLCCDSLKLGQTTSLIIHFPIRLFKAIVHIKDKRYIESMIQFIAFAALMVPMYDEGPSQFSSASSSHPSSLYEPLHYLEEENASIFANLNPLIVSALIDCFSEWWNARRSAVSQWERDDLADLFDSGFESSIIQSDETKNK